MGPPTRLAPVAIVVAALALAGSASADFDDLPGEPLQPASAAPYASVSPVTRSAEFNNSTFDEEDEELDQSPLFLGCGNQRGSKTAWMRFATRVSGRAYVRVDSSIPGPSGHDVFVKFFTAPTANEDYFRLSDRLTDSPGSTYCDASNPGLPDASVGLVPFLVPPGQTRIFYIQVLSVCANTPSTEPCPDPDQASAPGGQTKVEMTYYPDDRDSDGIADSLDACPAQANPCAVDGDGDGYFKNALPGAKEDCNDSDARVNPAPKRKEIRGNRKDDNCDGKALPWLRVTNGVTASFGGRRGRADLFTKLFVRKVTKGLRAVVECRGRGCPAPREYLVKKSRKRYSIRGRLGSVRLGPGARVTVKLLRKGRVGRVLVYRFRKSGTPKKPSKRCTLPGSRTVRKLSRCAPRGADAAAQR